MNRPACIVRTAEVKPEPYDRGKSGIAAAARDIGAAAGTRLLGIDVTEIPPGKKSSYLHKHSLKEEFFYVLSGRCRIRLGEETHDLDAGDAVSRPAGTDLPHQFSNPFDAPCSVLMIGVMAGEGIADVVEWPELKRRLVISPDGAQRISRL